jgi:streptomycin 6-kinase
VFSPTFLRNLRAAFGRGATDAWLARLPVLVADYERRWEARVECVAADLSYNYVAFARRADGEAVVLKIGIPNDEFRSEIEALRLYDGNGAVRLLEHDRDQCAMLLERIRPGVMLAERAADDDDAATAIAAEAMRRLRRPLNGEHLFHPMRRWVSALTELRQGFGGATGPLPDEVVALAEGLCAELLASTTETALLHGDLHHYNILSSDEHGWVVIDPKGLAGDPAYEPAALLVNPILHLPGIDDAALRRLTARRIAQLSESLSLDRRRVWAWGVVHAVLSACWGLDDEGRGWEFGIHCADVFRSVPFG